jgi:hypothetical protein
MSSRLKYQQGMSTTLPYDDKERLYPGSLLHLLKAYLGRHGSFTDFHFAVSGDLFEISSKPPKQTIALEPIDRLQTLAGYLRGMLLTFQLLSDRERKDLLYSYRFDRTKYRYTLDSVYIGGDGYEADSNMTALLHYGFDTIEAKANFLDPSLLLTIWREETCEHTFRNHLCTHYRDVTNAKEIDQEAKEIIFTMRACYLLQGHGCVQRLRYAIDKLHANPKHFVPITMIPTGAFESERERGIRICFGRGVTFRVYDEIISWRFYELKYQHEERQRESVKLQTEQIVRREDSPPSVRCCFASDYDRWAFGQRVMIESRETSKIEGWTVLHMMSADYGKRCDHRFGYLVEECNAKPFLASKRSRDNIQRDNCLWR